MDKKENDKHCQHCQKPLDAKAVQGLCPACLLKDWLAEKAKERVKAQSVEALPGFTPMCEVSLWAGPRLENCFLDLDTGRVLSAPQALVESVRGHGSPQVVGELATWIQNNDVDLFRRSNGLAMFDGFCIQVAKGQERAFETITPEKMARDGAYFRKFLDEELPVDPNDPMRTRFALRQEGGGIQNTDAFRSCRNDSDTGRQCGNR